MAAEYNFADIYKEYYQKIVRYLGNMAGPKDAEDIAQDVFDKISRSLAGFRGESKLSTWIYRIATNTAIDRMRTSAFRHSSMHTAFEEATPIKNTIDLSSHNAPPGIDQNVIRKEMSACVREFIDNLPLNYRTVIVLSELEGLSNQEIANVLEISLDNVKVRRHRARAKLKESLNEGCDFYLNEKNVLACDRKQPPTSPDKLK